MLHKKKQIQEENFSSMPLSPPPLPSCLRKVPTVNWKVIGLMKWTVSKMSCGTILMNFGLWTLKLELEYHTSLNTYRSFQVCVLWSARGWHLIKFIHWFVSELSVEIWFLPLKTTKSPPCCCPARQKRCTESGCITLSTSEFITSLSMFTRMSEGTSEPEIQPLLRTRVDRGSAPRNSCVSG